jgi:hypothetical protein
MTVCGMTPCDLVGAYQRLRVTWCLHFQEMNLCESQIQYFLRFCYEDDRYYSVVEVCEHSTVKVTNFVISERLLDRVLGG